MAEIILTQLDNHMRVQVQVNQPIVIRLAENPTTGYRWAVDDPDDNIMLAQDSYVQGSNSGIGAGGQHIFTFTISSVGIYPLSLKQWRAWEGERSVIGRFTVTLDVT